MKNKDLVNLYQSLTLIEDRKYSVKFSFFVAKNKLSMKDDFSILEEARKPDVKFIEYDTKRAKLAFDMADKDEKGQPNVENNSFVIVENIEQFKTDLDALKKEYSAIIKKQQKNFDDYKELLEDDIEYTGLKIDIKDVPDEIEPAVLESLLVANLITDTEE